MDYVIFTDGSSRGNPGPGGWGAIVVRRDLESVEVQEFGGGEKHTTNNRMELMAAVEALSHTLEDTNVIVHTDSSYLINGITKWIHGWKRNGWKTKTKDDVLNKDLWSRLHELAEKRGVTWKYVGGHIGVIGNERCDEIATAYADDEKPKMYIGSMSKYELPDILDIKHDDKKVTSKKKDSAHSRAKAYSYVSCVAGVVEVHHTWAECEKRVKGTRGAKFKKALNAAGEKELIESFESI